uniref:Potassium channel domain-containing protein n=1 Tax=Setaria digitata TaxID=48799 RepID=A0A915PN87_9BILA
MEDKADREQQLSKLHKIRDTYRKIAEIAGEECPIASKQSHFRPQLFETIAKLSSYMEGRDFLLNPDIDQLEELILPKWTTVPSILYALSILTTTGYLSAVPMTKLGQFIAVVYGLVGIPLMVLAAVDIGHFLSDIVLRLYRKYCLMKRKLTKACSCSEKKRHVMEMMETKAISRVPGIRKRGKKEKEMIVTVEESNSEAKHLPLAVNASILLIFCMLGGVCYTVAGGQKSFLEAFFVTFNLVANLTMAEMPNDLNNILTFFYIFIFVTFGLAVLSMCGNLAASELRAVFMKIHYFGRKISWRRQQISKGKECDLELTEMLKVIIAIQELHPDKEEITSEDIMEILNEVHHKPYSNLYKYKRRDTIAFMPQSFEALRFADELDVDDTIHRTLSQNHLSPLK